MLIPILIILGILIVLGSIGLNIFLYINIKRVVSKTEQIQEAFIQIQESLDENEEFYRSLRNRISRIINTMQQIDTKGAFEADDEVGHVFQQMKMLIQSLDVYILEDEDVKLLTENQNASQE